MKKLFIIAVVALCLVLTLSSCSKDSSSGKAKSTLTSLTYTEWVIANMEGMVELCFTSTSFEMYITDTSGSNYLTGDYSYDNPDFTTSNLKAGSGETPKSVSGSVSYEGDELYLTMDGYTATLIRK